MKNIIKKSWVILLVGVMACTDLNLTPKDRATSDVLLTTPEGVEKFLAKMYLGLANTGQNGPAGAGDIATGDEGFSQYMRALWNAEEMPTDEAVTLWGDPNLKDYHAHSWTSQSAFLTQFYYRIFYQIALANLFLKETTDSKMASRGLPASFISNTLPIYRAEARTLRALSYWHGLNYFRNIPYSDENSGTEKPQQKDATFIFNFVESELLAVEPTLLPQRTNVYGRFDKGVARIILAKLYLNAEVYGQGPKYTECISVLNKIITPTGGDLAYSLSPGYQDNFLTDNNTSPEMIFYVPADGIKTPNYGGITLVINGAIGGQLASLPQVGGRNPIMGNNQSWAGHRTTKALVNLFPDETGVLDGRALWYTAGQNKEINDINQFTDGYMVTKFRNVSKAGVPGQDGTFTDTDYPLFRYADVLLMYAEAVTRGGTGGSAVTALNYVNQIRQRAYGADYGTGTAPGLGVLTSLDLNTLLDERGREFYWEGHRRTDMIRFGVFTNNPTNNPRGLWPWKGNVKDGRTTEAFRDIYPIPATDVIANPNLKQNTGY
ncbi:MAG: RagB/SusD family nutrient uptake outer membrane protein [Cyclobacteriaceae bacterium]|nr:RagB/SusD family nutrient uptake outer membrane protein [Cyclobacteriaceae bacterium]